MDEWKEKNPVTNKFSFFFFPHNYQINVKQQKKKCCRFRRKIEIQVNKKEKDGKKNSQFDRIRVISFYCIHTHTNTHKSS